MSIPTGRARVSLQTPVLWTKTAIVGRRVAFVAVVLLLSSACSKNNGSSRDDYEGIGGALDEQDPPDDSDTSAEVSGVDVAKLDAGEKRRFGKLLNRLPSPCGKSHSLRKSIAEDQSCKRATFAGRYVATLVGEDEDDLTIRALYDARYRNDKVFEFTVDKAAFNGTRSAPIVFVEFLDYG